MRNSKALRLFDFSGGLNTQSPVTSLKTNEALDLQNINLFGPPGQTGFEKRQGNTAFNSSAMASGAAVHGLGYYRQADQDEWLMAICGTKLFKSEFDGTMDDITGAVTITAGQDNIWTHSVMNDLSIWVGGAPDAPIKWTGAGNAAALGGSPNSGSFGITANNRFFIGNTTASPSTIYWSILGNPEDWSGTGSGNQDVSKNDGDTLVGAARLGVDHLLLFKENSIHDLNIRLSPFPLFPLFRGVGAVSKRGIVEVDGMIYFITPEPRMKATDGSQVISFPDTINATWDGLSKTRLKYIQGFYYPKLRQIWWICSNTTSSTHNYCIIWDLERKCWIRHPTGYKMNCMALAKDRTPYGAAYDGVIYQQDVASTYVDGSESGAAINAYWRSGWLDIEDLLDTKTIPYIKMSFKNQTTGTFDFAYGYNFSSDRATEIIPMAANTFILGTSLLGSGILGAADDTTYFVHMKGSGSYTQLFFRNRNENQAFKFNGSELPVKIQGVTR